MWNIRKVKKDCKIDTKYDAPHSIYSIFYLSPLTLGESDISALCGITPSVCPINKPTVASKRESAIVKDPNFIALSKFMNAEYVADVKFFV